MTYLEMVKGKITVKITKMNCQIQKLANEDDKPKYQIGFAITNENEDDADEDI